jgi:hypothetical protein
VSIDLVSIECTFSHHPSVGVVHGFRKVDCGDKIRAIVKVALGWKDSFTFATRYSVSLRYRNYFGCRAGYLFRVLPTECGEYFESCLLHHVGQVSPLYLTLPHSQTGLIGHMEIFTFTSQRRSWPVVMISRVEYYR